jgi:hypothetical protein
MYIYNMSDQPTDTNNDARLTKPKKQRSEAQIAATERMRSALEAKQTSASKVSPTEKKLRLQAIKEQLNGPSKKAVVKEVQEAEESEEEEEKPKPAVVHKPKKEKKPPKIVYESESESEEEVIVVKKKRKPKKTIIYEEESEEEAPPPKPKTRETKTQQNVASKFKVTPAEIAAPKGPVYYFAD